MFVRQSVCVVSIISSVALFYRPLEQHEFCNHFMTSIIYVLMMPSDRSGTRMCGFGEERTINADEGIEVCLHVLRCLCQCPLASVSPSVSQNPLSVQR